MSTKILFRKYINFINRQKVEVYKGGITIFLQKFSKLCFAVIMLPLFIIIRLLKPFVCIRFGPLFSSQIGHFAANTEVYLRERDNGLHDRTFDIFHYLLPICNQQLKTMWERTRKLHIFQPSRLAYLGFSVLPGGRQHIIDIFGDKQRDTKGITASTPPYLFFTHAEENYGKAALYKMGIPTDAQFVCFHARDSAYSNSKKMDYSYHNYRDFNIYNMLPAAKELARRGYYVIRMGKIVATKLHSENPMIIDYATNGSRNDFMDIYILAKCSFFLTSDAGICTVAEHFRRPHAFVNFSVLGRAHTWNPQPFIFKKPWLIADKRFMTLQEILVSGVGEFLFTKQYVRFGVELIENTPEEITALAVEVDERLKGLWQTSEEDEKLQHRFWKIFRKHANPKLHGIYRTRIGADFLRQNLEWLGLD